MALDGNVSKISILPGQINASRTIITFYKKRTSLSQLVNYARNVNISFMCT